MKAIPQNVLRGVSLSVNNSIPRFDGITGKLIQTSDVIIDDSDNIILPDDSFIKDTANGFNMLGYDSGLARVIVGAQEDRDVWLQGWTNRIKLLDGEINYGATLHRIGTLGDGPAYTFIPMLDVNSVGAELLGDLTLSGGTRTLTFDDGIETATMFWDSQNDGLSITANNAPITYTANGHSWDGGLMTFNSTGWTNLLPSAMGSLGIISAAQILNMSEAFAATGTKNGINLTITNTAASGTSGATGIAISSTNNAAAGTPSVRGITIASNIGAAANFAANAWIGSDVSRTAVFQAGTIVDTIGIRVNAVTYLSSTFAATAYGIRIGNQGIAGTTDSYGIRIDSQSGSTNNYGIVVGAGRSGFGTITPTALVHLAAGASAASSAPLKFTSGTNLATGETGAMEYNGTNLFFTRTGTTRESVFVGNDGAAAPATNAIGVIIDYFGTSATRVLTTPNSWASVVVAGSTYKIPLYS